MCGQTADIYPCRRGLRNRHDGQEVHHVLNCTVIPNTLPEPAGSLNKLEKETRLCPEKQKRNNPGEEAADTEISDSDKAARNDTPASGNATTDGAKPDEANSSIEEAGNGNTNEIELPPESPGDIPLNAGESEAASADEPAPELPPENREYNESSAGKEIPKAPTASRKRKAKAAPVAKPEPPARKAAPFHYPYAECRCRGGDTRKPGGRHLA